MTAHRPAGEARPLRFAYADPPYIGKAKKHYGPDAKEVNFPLLIRYLADNFDGAALSCNATNLRTLLPLCPEGARVCPWVKTFAVFKPGVNPGYCWEPVIVWGSRPYRRTDPTVMDWISCPITMGRGAVGAKPEPVCFAIFRWLNAQPGDQLTDVFPGSKAVTRAWGRFVGQMVLVV